MTGLLDALATPATVVVGGLARASVIGALYILAVWGLCRLLPRLSPSTRAVLWWLAAVRVLVGFVWIGPFVLPLLPWPEPTVRVETAASGQVGIGATGQLRPAGDASGGSALSARPPSRTPPAQAPRWPKVVSGTWLAGVAVGGSVTLRHLRRVRAVARRARTAGPEIGATADALARRVGLARPPDVRLSDEIDTPVVVGFARPVLLLPSPGFAGLSGSEQEMAICHELMHVHRRDLWLGCVPAVVERAFFFHPLVRLVAREYLLAREAACDAGVLHVLGAEPHDYGRLLCALGVTQLRTRLGAAGAPQSAANLKRRIIMLRSVSLPGSPMRTTMGIAVVAAFCALVPVQLGARTGAQPAQRAAADGASAGSAQSQKRDSYVLLDERGHTVFSGSLSNTDRARRFQRGGEALLWFRRDGREYVCRDAAVTDSTRHAFQWLSEIGRRQREIRLPGETRRRQAERTPRAAGEPAADLHDVVGELREVLQDLRTQASEISRDLESGMVKANADVRDILTRAIASGAASEVK
jgi:beta-lactamase regulating signal transducer with metallopeptidase domain